MANQLNSNIESCPGFFLIRSKQFQSNPAKLLDLGCEPLEAARIATAICDFDTDADPDRVQP